MTDRFQSKSPAHAKRAALPKPRENSLSATSDPSGHTNPSVGSASTSGHSYLSENNNPANWADSSSNVENVKRALGQLEAMVDDAVFLDDDTFNGMKTLAHYDQKLQNAQRKIRQLTEQLLAARSQLARKDQQIKEEREQRKQVEEKVTELNGQLESNAVVFETHVAELLRRNEEIERLVAVIEGLGAANIQG